MSNCTVLAMVDAELYNCNNYRLLHTLPLHIDYYLDESKTSQDTIDKKGKVCDKVLIFVFRTFFGTNVDQTVQASNFTQFS